jgi:hypothetical protein
MTAPWQDVRCASIPEGALPALADLRREAGIRVTVARGRAWVSWDDGPASEATRRILVERLMPLSGVELFSRHDGRWHRLGERLPAFDATIGDHASGARLDRVIVPVALELGPPGGDAPRRVALRLVRDDRGRVRPAAGVRCRLLQVVEWAERAPSGWIESLSGTWCAPAGTGPGDAEVLVIGPPPRLPSPRDGLRFWGNDVLIPLGYRASPELTERALRDVVGAAADDLVVLDEEGPELISRGAFRPLSRASIRLAMAARGVVPDSGGGRP